MLDISSLLSLLSDLIQSPASVNTQNLKIIIWHDQVNFDHCALFS